MNRIRLMKAFQILIILNLENLDNRITVYLINHHCFKKMLPLQEKALINKN